MTAVISLILIAALTVCDQLIKLLAYNNLRPVEKAELIDGFIGLRYVENTGAAFGSFSGNTLVLTVFTGAVLLAGLILIVSGKIRHRGYLVCAVMITAGGTGNLIDRIFRGFVVDYIEPLFMNFAVFNFADILVTVGAFLLIGIVIFDAVREKRGTEKR